MNDSQYDNQTDSSMVESESDGCFITQEQALEILRVLLNLDSECSRSLEPWCITSPDCSYDGQYGEYAQWLIKALEQSRNGHTSEKIAVPPKKYDKIMMAYQVAREFTEFCNEINID